jgi:hypothetical protein
MLPRRFCRRAPRRATADHARGTRRSRRHQSTGVANLGTTVLRARSSDRRHPAGAFGAQQPPQLAPRHSPHAAGFSPAPFSLPALWDTATMLWRGPRVPRTSNAENADRSPAGSGSFAVLRLARGLSSSDHPLGPFSRALHPLDPLLRLRRLRFWGPPQKCGVGGLGARPLAIRVFRRTKPTNNQGDQSC